MLYIHSLSQSSGNTVCPALELCGVRVCQVGFSALLLISSVHVGSGAAPQSEEPRSSPLSLSLTRENRNTVLQIVKHVLTKDKLLGVEREKTESVVRPVKASLLTPVHLRMCLFTYTERRKKKQFYSILEKSTTLSRPGSNIRPE